MDSPISVASQLNCTQCGGELHPDEGQMFLTCPYCGATVYVDRARVVFHWYVAPTLNEQQAVAALYRWMSGSQTVKDLDKKARVTGQSFEYFPVWYFRRAAAGNVTGGKEEVSIQPAAATSVTELAKLNLPAGDLRKYDPGLDGQAVPPTVPLQAALEWTVARSQFSTEQKTVLPGMVGPALQNMPVRESSLVHVPLYFFKYDYNGNTYAAVVDAASGTVMANLFPPKNEAPFLLVGGVTALVFLCLAVFPVISPGNDASLGLGICIGGGIIAAPILFAWAFWVASRV